MAVNPCAGPGQPYSVIVWCPCCPHHLPHWSCCYVYRYHCYMCVYVYYCYKQGETPREGDEMKKGPGGEEEAQATLVVTLPEDARLSIDDQPTQSTSSTRTFLTPPLESGKSFTYTLKAEVVRDGKTQTVTQTATVRAGEETRVNINIPSATTAAR